jgi:hypothetical protein
MIQPRQHLRFAGEAGEPVGIGRKGLQDLDATSRFNLVAHAALAEFFGHLVV